MSGPASPPPRPARTDYRRPPDRRRRSRGVTRSAAVLLVLVALAVGVLVGYIAAGDPGTGGPVTQTREVRVVTVTVPEAP